ncbi:MAG: hypothetical protein KDI15_11945, partial [Thiothrix sp.]|nr:hypothetical protein [Thiothrix sp.]
MQRILLGLTLLPLMSVSVFGETQWPEPGTPETGVSAPNTLNDVPGTAGSTLFPPVSPPLLPLTGSGSALPAGMSPLEMAAALWPTLPPEFGSAGPLPWGYIIENPEVRNNQLGFIIGQTLPPAQAMPYLIPAPALPGQNGSATEAAALKNSLADMGSQQVDLLNQSRQTILTQKQTIGKLQARLATLEQQQDKTRQARNLVDQSRQTVQTQQQAIEKLRTQLEQLQQQRDSALQDRSLLDQSLQTLQAQQQAIGQLNTQLAELQQQQGSASQTLGLLDQSQQTVQAQRQ